jgi:hypothetical protein
MIRQEIIFKKIKFFNLQRIIYSNYTPVDGTAEAQDVPALSETFQIGFKGVYTS